MRLLFVHEKLGAFGGAEANILATATELAARGHTVALAHGTRSGRGEEAWERLFQSRYSLASADEGAALAAAIAEFQPDVVYLHKLAEETALETLVRSDVPTVRMVHDHDLYCMRSYKYNPLSRRICTRAASAYCVFPCGASLCRAGAGRFSFRWVSYFAKRRELELNRRFSRLVVATDYMREELVRNGFAPGRIERHAPVPRSAPALARANFGPRNRLVYAGQIIRGKGVDVLLESLARVTEPFECLIVGEGSHRAYCERLRDHLRLRNRVHFLGFQPQDQLAGYYGEASLAVMSSVWPEPFGATGLEAMRCGLPVVAFDAGGIREWLLDGVNGFLVPWMDRAAYAGRIDFLLRDKVQARQLGETGRQLASERFGFSAYVDGLEDLFKRTAPALRTEPAMPVTAALSE